ncbi:osmotically-inducible protein OsmY [Chitinivorax tropicus]|uniref:Osmotically-inducible protein OsmY n=1 Tax=Chitinivorax tropicus TaxID=714531 RepID=A0A840MLM9_9PROT|nr:BON domain-containing protein [Chitinivorax tropicus]MBB5020064.1 osmotically-inducible protein OsmY [Chitinivorax tropicus]
MKKTYVLIGLMTLAMPVLQGCVPLVVGATAGTVLVANDRRTTGTLIDDRSIELKLENRLKDEFGDRAHVNVTSYNRAALLTGEAESGDVKQGAERAARTIPGVGKIHNEIVIGPNASLGSRTSDATTTTRVKTALIGNTSINANQIKVVTEAGSVYLMGMVSRFEGKTAADIAASISGVKRVVTLFEYLD